MPPAKFWTVPLRAMPMAIPPAASRAARELVFTPRVPTTIIMTITHDAVVTRLSVKETIAGSVFFFSKSFFRKRLRTLMSQAPTAYRTRASRTFSPKPMASWARFESSSSAERPLVSCLASISFLAISDLPVVSRSSVVDISNISASVLIGKQN